MPRKRTHEMAYKAENYTVMANDIIRGKQSMTLQEARLIRLLITQVAQGDTDYQTYSCRIVDLADFLGVPKNNIYRDIPDICKGLMQNVVYIGTGNKRSPWRMFHWVSLAEYDGAGTITLRLSDEIKPYVLDLEKWFTRYPLGNILAMRSYYSIRLYELIKCQDGVGRAEKDFIDFDIEELRQACGCEGKFERISQFKAKVIELAVQDINQNTDIWVEVEYIKTGKRITNVRFHIHDKPKKRKKKQLPGQMEL